VFTAHRYGRLEAGDRTRFVAGAWRVAPELIVMDAAARHDHAREGCEEWQTRVLGDGSRFRVYKRYVVRAQTSR
jgi:hypothetical protein